ncbi:hypothetical protein BX666DRAFT_1983570 [Dichotomocladium elegans]|nr:hypothetical protein BX666DRAFT_1983570 [Dichotomocladium elegans]
MTSFSMPFLNSKRRSHTPPVHTSPAPLISRPNTSAPAVYSTQQNNGSNSSLIPSPRSVRSSFDALSSYQSSRSSSPVPTPSTSWTSEMSLLADKMRDNTIGMPQAYSMPFENLLDRKSIAQGMKLVAIAADEYEDGNGAVGLDIYLSGIDKILMALPNKTDPKTKTALREKLTSVEERVGILHIATQHRQKHLQDEQWDDPETKKSLLEIYGLSRLTSTLGTITTIAASRAYGGYNTPTQSNPGSPTLTATKHHSSSSLTNNDSMARFRQFGQVLIHAAVTLAILIKQSPLPDMILFIFGYFCQLLYWVDRQYQLSDKAQEMGIECVKFMLQMDEEYRLHEFASEFIYMLIAAVLKAAVAYKEAPAFKYAATANANGSATLQPVCQEERAIKDANSTCVVSSECPPKPPSRWLLW